MAGDPLRDLRRAPPTPGWRELSERQFRARRHLDDVAERLIRHRYEPPEETRHDHP